MKPSIRWTPENIARLRSILMRSPRPLVPSIAAEMQTSVASIKTAISRTGLTATTVRGTGGTRPDYTAMAMRGCITCDSPFLSEGKHNRMCPRCKLEASEIAA